MRRLLTMCVLSFAAIASGKTTMCKGESAELPHGKEPGRFQINNRRYLGNKYKLLDFIRRIVDENCRDVHTFVDIFAGTGSVASAFPDKKLIVNDILYSNHICHLAWFSGEEYSEEMISSIIAEYNRIQPKEDNYMSETFGGTYFSKEDCRKIGFVREDIEERFRSGEINQRERAMLITSLLYAMDKIANTVGHYDAYMKDGRFGKRLEMRVPDPPECAHRDNLCFQEDANDLAPKLGRVDVFFMDPPYNSRQYGDAYHLLENVAKWEKPPVEGVALKMDRTSVKSDYCTRRAEEAFADLVGKIDARYIVLTYNNMAKKGNDRSNARLSDAAIMRILESKGKVEVFSRKHKAFSTGKSDRSDNEERIFLCTCAMVDGKDRQYIESPLNYTGGKYKILDQLIPNFPTNIETFIDLFCGGANVGVNVTARRVVLQDDCKPLIDMFKAMQNSTELDFIRQVKDVIEDFGLSDSDAHGYAYYGCDSSKGLSAYNKEPYLKLRRHYAELPEEDIRKSAEFYALIVYGFNNQIRFNGKGEFNLPVGKRDFNAKMQKKLAAFMRRLHAGNFDFRAGDFRDCNLGELGRNDFVYADPPYLVTTAAYNERGGWTERDERDLLDFLDKIDSRGCGFALSNVTESKGRRNEILVDWIERNCGRYRVVEISRDYSNANYHRKSGGETREILVTNR